MRHFVMYLTRRLSGSKGNSGNPFLHFESNPSSLMASYVRQFITGYFLFVVEKIVRRGAFLGMKEMKNSKSDQTVLVVANGPSSNFLDDYQIAKAKISGGLEVIGINFSKYVWDSSLITLDYLVVSDPQDHPAYLSNALENPIWKYLRENPSVRVISPTHWHGKIQQKSCVDLTCLHFFDYGRNNFSKKINPLFIPAFPHMTSFKALAIAHYWRYQKILVCGLDNSFYTGVYLSEGNKIFQKSVHYKTEYEPPVDMTSKFPSGIGDYFYFVSQNFLALKKYFSESNILDLNPNSIVDAFRKVTFEDPEHVYLKTIFD
jgi:hypothetical protein